MKKSQLRIWSAMALLVACLFFIGASPFSYFDDLSYTYEQRPGAAVPGAGPDSGLQLHGSDFTLTAVDMAFARPAVKGSGASGATGIKSSKNTRAFILSLLILYMLTCTLIHLGKSCFYTRNQLVYYVRYILMLLNVIHEADGKSRTIHAM